MIFEPTKMTFPNDDNVVKINDIPINRIGDDNNENFSEYIQMESFFWKNHIKVTSIRINNGLFALNSLKNILPQNTIKTTYYLLLVHCHITYCLVVWGNSPSIN